MIQSNITLPAQRSTFLSRWFTIHRRLTRDTVTSKGKCAFGIDRVCLPIGSSLHRTKWKKFPKWNKEVVLSRTGSQLSRLTKYQWWVPKGDKIPLGSKGMVRSIMTRINQKANSFGLYLENYHINGCLVHNFFSSHLKRCISSFNWNGLCMKKFNK